MDGLCFGAGDYAGLHAHDADQCGPHVRCLRVRKGPLLWFAGVICTFYSDLYAPPPFRSTANRALASLRLGTARQECIFRRLINDNFVERQYNGKALLITACGFPDVQTRMLLNRLSREYPALPIYGIADLDPYGDLSLYPRERLIALPGRRREIASFYLSPSLPPLATPSSLSLYLSLSLTHIPSLSFPATRVFQNTKQPGFDPLRLYW